MTPGLMPSGVNCNIVPPFQKNLLDKVLNPLNDTAGPLPFSERKNDYKIFFNTLMKTEK